MPYSREALVRMYMKRGVSQAQAEELADKRYAQQHGGKQFQERNRRRKIKEEIVEGIIADFFSRVKSYASGPKSSPRVQKGEQRVLQHTGFTSKESLKDPDIPAIYRKAAFHKNPVQASKVSGIVMPKKKESLSVRGKGFYDYDTGMWHSSVDQAGEIYQKKFRAETQASKEAEAKKKHAIEAPIFPRGTMLRHYGHDVKIKEELASTDNIISECMKTRKKKKSVAKG